MYTSDEPGMYIQVDGLNTRYFKPFLKEFMLLLHFLCDGCYHSHFLAGSSSHLFLRRQCCFNLSVH